MSAQVWPGAASPRAPGHDGRAARLRAPVLVALAVIALSVALHVRDPHQHGSWGLCPWLALTGTACPGCGGLRAVNDLTRGDVAAAASSNLPLVAALPVLVVAWFRSVVRRWQGPVVAMSAHRTQLLTLGLAAVALVFTVLRNLPAGSWLAP